MYYLINVRDENFQSGSLVQFYKDKYYYVNDSNKTSKYGIPYGFRIPNSWTLLTEIEMKYLLKRDLKTRIYIHKHRIFEKILKLKPNDLCYLNDDKSNKWRITEIKNENVTVNLHGKQKTVSILEIEYIEIIKYYLSMDKRGPIDAGDIIIENDGLRKRLNDGYILHMDIGRCDEISNEEANYLSRCPRDGRVGLHSDKVWENISKLTINSYCYLSTEVNGLPYRIVGKCKTRDGVKYTLYTKSERTIEVDELDIRAEPVRSRRSSSIDDPLEKLAKAEILSRRFGSLNAVSPTKSIPQGQIDVNNDLPSIPPIRKGLSIIYPWSLRKFGDNIPIKSQRRLVLLIQNTVTVAALKWKGIIDDRICIGCEMDTKPNYRGEGGYNFNKYFPCDNDRGAFIALSDNDCTCERVDGVCHDKITTKMDKIVDQDSICCIDSTSTNEYEYLGKHMVISNDIRGTCKWKGLLNGIECIGIHLSNSVLAVGYANDGLVAKMKLFEYQSLKGALFRLEDIATHLRCVDNNLDIINPWNIKRIETELSCDKILSLKQGTSSLIVTLKWKGKVNGRMCIGCVLNKDSKYGTIGRFKDNKMFECVERRGVLIELNDRLQCCENRINIRADGRVHNEIIYKKNKFIDDKCICCAEKQVVLMSAQHICIGKSIIFMDYHQGEVKWMGLINGEECIGLGVTRGKPDADIYVKEMSYFDDVSGQVVLIKVADIVTHLRCTNNNVEIVNLTNIETIHTEQSCDKILCLKQSASSLIVTLKWKGSVNGRKCIGCELLSKCKYGTMGKFKDKQIFDCADRRGVLIELGGSVDCCESRVNVTPGACIHNDIICNKYNFIDDKSICCAENVSKLASAEHIRIGKPIIFYDNHSGIIKWIGLINGVECVGMETANKYGLDMPFKEIPLCDCRPNCGILLKLSDIPLEILCDPIGLNVINPTMIGEIVKTDPIYKYVILENKDTFLSLEVMWKGMVDGRECAGCILPSLYKFGTNGTFRGQQLFDCIGGKGILMGIDKLNTRCKSENNEHKSITKPFINPKMICCIEQMHQLNMIPQINVGSKVFFHNDTKKNIRECLWIGKVNGEECVGLDLTTTGGVRADGIFHGVKLFDCKVGQGVLSSVEHFDLVPRFNLVKDMYLKNDHKFAESDTKDLSNACKLVKILDNPPIYGRTRFTVCDQYLTAVRIRPDVIEKNIELFKDIIFKDDNLNCIIVLTNCIEAFKEKLAERENIVDVTSVKEIERCKQINFVNGDFVTYKSGDNNSYGRILKHVLLNNVRCLGIVNTLNINNQNTEIFIREEVATKVIIDGTLSQYIAGVVYDPQYIATFEESNMDHMSRNDEVTFKLRGNVALYKGKIVLTAKANYESCAMVELNGPLPGIDMNKINVKAVMPYQPWCDSCRNEVAIIADCVLRVTVQKILKCDSNKVFVVDPKKLGEVKEINKENKIIIFKSNGDRIMSRLRWVGSIDDEIFLGCDMMNPSKYGTNGIFGDHELFQCDERHGVLIPLGRISECCIIKSNHKIVSSIISMVAPPHKGLRLSADRSIIGSSICCVQTLDKLDHKSEFCVGTRVMQVTKNGRICGVCRWIGLINNKEAIGLGMGRCCVGVKDDMVDEVVLLIGLTESLRLFLAEDFAIDSVGLLYCSKSEMVIVDSNNIQRIENGKQVDVKMMFKRDNADAMLPLKWKGVINGVLCVGCELTSECDCRTDGCFGGEKLFECLAQRGVLIPSDTLNESCQSIGKDRGISKERYGNISSDSICCVEKVDKIRNWPQITIGSIIKHKEVSGVCGVCKWFGLINGEESVGVKMKQSIKGGTNGRFGIFDLFTCKGTQGCLFLATDIVHDLTKEIPHHYVDILGDVIKITKVNQMKQNDNQFSIGDYVSTNVKKNGEKKSINGILRWKGIINNNNIININNYNGVKCVGIDLEEECDVGMDGIIKDKDKYTFKCLPGHGLITTTDNVMKITDKLTLRTIDGIIDPNKYIVWEEKWFKNYLTEKEVSKNGFVTVKIDDNGNILTMKGVLRNSGFMNDEPVAVVELDKDFKHGTNGRFWRQNVIQCEGKKAIAVLWENIHKYSPYEEMNIPVDQRIFKEIDVNSAVVYYAKGSNKLSTLYGTVRWSGRNDLGQYLYGIDLDDRLKDGSDGKFQGTRLFECSGGHGVLVPIGDVAPDIRFLEAKFEDEDISISKISEQYQFATPVKSFRGENMGIQGNANSCYFDSSIFALLSKSDVLDFMISPMINAEEENETTKTFREQISRSIVYPLREFGFVSFHHTLEMRKTIMGYGGKFEEMMKQVSDMENVAALLSKLCPKEQLLSLRSFSGTTNTGMFLQLFIILNEPPSDISSQQMLEMSMAQSDIMFDKPPTCLIMQAPRDARGINCYDYVLPSKTIEVSNLCYPCFKECKKCDNRATFQCKRCIEESSLRVANGLFCENDKCGHEERLEIPDSVIHSRSKIQMTLKAIICIERAHFVTYVKEDEFSGNWVFFDSMSTQNTTNNYAVPKVSFDKEVSNFLNMDEADMKSDVLGYSNPRLKRILKDSYIFVYHNTAQTCY